VFRSCDEVSPLAVSAAIQDDSFGTADQVTRVVWTWSGFISGSAEQTQPYIGQVWRSPTMGNIEYLGKPNDGGTFTITANAYDRDGQSAALTSGGVIVTPCRYVNQIPEVVSVSADQQVVYAVGCKGTTVTRLTIRVFDSETSPGRLSVNVATALMPVQGGQLTPAFSGPASFAGGDRFAFDWGPRDTNRVGPYHSVVRVTITVTDEWGGSSTRTFDRVFEYIDCFQG
jgi:hypothetical protein